MKIVCKCFENEIKCPGCNWNVMMLYSFDCNNIAKEGLCANCFMDLLCDEKYDVRCRNEQSNK
jgi:hypothetical protein